MNVWHLVYVADSLTYTIARALTHGGHTVTVRAVGNGVDRRPDAIQRRIAGTLGVTLVDEENAELPDRIDRLVVQAFPRPAETLRAVDVVARRARRISLISAGDRSRTRRSALGLQWRETRTLARHADRVDRVLYKDGHYRQDLFGCFKPRSVVGFDVHSQFLHDPELFRAMHARDWASDAARPIRVSFLGSRDPIERARILDEVRALFPRTEHAQSSREEPAGRPAGERVVGNMFWHEYSDAAPDGLPPPEFVRLLTDSDFTLCPRGWSLVTHRPVEALLRGCIPVLSDAELDLYGIELVHGVNCIAVPHGRWRDTVRSLGAMDLATIVAMRRSASAMFERSLAYDALARRLRGCVGVPDPGET